MNFKIGDYVSIPSGEVLQIKEIMYHWVHLYGVKENNLIDDVCDLTLNRGHNNYLIIRDYQCTYVSGMESCAG